MFKKAKGLVKNSKGFTLVELLAVIVILAIIAGIAVPSIGGIINNSKKDAHIANAQQIIAAARIYAASENPTTKAATIEDLVDNKYLEDPVDPFNKNKYTDTANGGTAGSCTGTEVNCVTWDDDGIYTVWLVGSGSSDDDPRNIDGVTSTDLNTKERKDILTN